jgi:hypothetical protein
MRTRTILAFAAFLCLTAIVGERTWKNLNVPDRPFEQLYGAQDFRDTFYYPSIALRDGRNPYDVADYLAHYPVARPLPAYTPISLVVHLPFSYLPLRAAEAAYFAAGAAMLLALAWLALSGAGAPVTAARVAGLAALLVASRPGHQTLFLGQCTIVVALGTALALVQARRHPWLAGAGLALACLKPTYGLPLAVLMLFRRDMGAFLRGALIAAGVALPGAVGVVRAAGGVWAFVDSVIRGMDAVAADPSFHEASSLIRIDATGLLGRFMEKPPGIEGALLGVAIVLATGVVLWRRAATENDAPRPVSDGLACLAILLCVYHQSYDALLLALPATAVAMPARGRWPAAWRLRWLMLALLLLPGVNYLATDTLVDRLAPAPWAWLLIATANGAAILAAFILWMGLALRRAPPGSAP